MTTEMLVMLGIGVAVVGVNGYMMNGLRQEMRAGFAELRQEIGALRECLIDLGEQLARLEGAFDGFMERREPSEGRTA